MEILPGLHCVKGRASNIFILIGEDGLVLVDAGAPGDAKRILGYIKDIGGHPSDITSIWITHADYDHAGSAAVLQEQSRATIYASEQSAELLTVGKSPKHLPRLIQFITNHFVKYGPVPSEHIHQLVDGEMIPQFDEWVALATPGHSPDHFAFYGAKKGVLFAGDALNTRGGTLNLGRKRITGNLGLARMSAMRLLRLTPALFACGHGQPMMNHNADELFMLHRELENQLL